MHRADMAAVSIGPGFSEFDIYRKIYRQIRETTDNARMSKSAILDAQIQDGVYLCQARDFCTFFFIKFTNILFLM